MRYRFLAARSFLLSLALLAPWTRPPAQQTVRLSGELPQPGIGDIEAGYAVSRDGTRALFTADVAGDRRSELSRPPSTDPPRRSC